MERKEDTYSYIFDWYSPATFAKAYKYPVQPLPSEEFWPDSGLGPLQRRNVKILPGRPRVARRKARLEPVKGQYKLSRHGRVMHCSICGSDTHNVVTCPQQTAKGKGKSNKGKKKVQKKGQQQAEGPTTRGTSKKRKSLTQGDKTGSSDQGKNSKKQKKKSHGGAASQPTQPSAF